VWQALQPAVSKTLLPLTAGPLAAVCGEGVGFRPDAVTPQVGFPEHWAT
jgi:hypothetical protein